MTGTSILAVSGLQPASPIASAQAQPAKPAAPSGRRPNILVIFGDDIGIPQISAYTMGLMGYRTPIVLYTTDNGAEIALWPDGAMTPFKSEKGTTWEGGLRIPMMVRWPGVIKPGTVYNDIISLIDWFPTLCAAAGVADIKGKMASGLAVGGKTFKVHLDGYDFMPYFRGGVNAGPRDAIYYFDQGGNLNAIRWNDWKVSFAQTKGNIATGVREVTAWALITNLRMDPYERGFEEGGEAMKFVAEQMWLLVPIQGKIKEFFGDFEKFPYQAGSSLNAGGIGYGMLRQAEAMKRLKELERITPP